MTQASEIDQHPLYEQFEELQRYVGWTEGDGSRLAAVAGQLEPHLPPLIEDFYEQIRQHPQAHRVITGGEAQIQRLKGTLMDWLRELLSGHTDAEYVLRRWRVGWRHVEVGLPQVYTNVAVSRLRTGLAEALEDTWTSDPTELRRTRRALHKRIDLDLALIEHAYQSEHTARQTQLERLAATGQVAGGIVHELRQPLNVIKTSIYYLRHATNPSAESTNKHLGRMERQVSLANSVIVALSDFAKMPAPSTEPIAPADLFERALEAEMLPEEIVVRRDIPKDLPPVLADADQIRIALGNIIRNARDAMQGESELFLSAKADERGVHLTLADTGPGIAADQLDRVTEPLYTSKARGIGLGLAIARAIIENHGGELKVASEAGHGAIITVVLPRTEDE